jgi:acetoin utilization deacetylase AcuC-like enzyme
MILYDPSFAVSYRDYGIMLPISPSRAGKIVDFLGAAGRVFDSAALLRLIGDNGAAKGPEGASGAALITRGDIERVHDKQYAAALYGDGPLGQAGLERALLDAYELVDAEGKPNRYEPSRAVKPLSALFNGILAQVGGSYLACRAALRTGSGGAGFCYYLGGGMHHARYDCGAGFCLVNDIMIAAGKIQAEKRASLIWIVDVDAHKGCGTAELVRLERERGELGASEAAGASGRAPQIFNLSIHMARGWPLDGETLKTAAPGRAPLVPADVEIPIESGEESRYIPELEKGLGRLEELSAGRRPDLAIVVDGADPYEHDGLPSSGLLSLTLDQCVERDRLIFRFLAGRGIASAWIMAGGYGERAWEPAAHFLRTVFS